jgi:ubiquinone/menaquinone biosynthesis C-methylase UbiE
MLEDLTFDNEFDLAFINISLHEARDFERAADNVWRALRPNGVFVVSDFPFPDTQEDLRTPAGRFKAGIQFFEVQIDDQLLPTAAFADLLRRHGFRGVTSVDLTPAHALTFGRR